MSVSIKTITQLLIRVVQQLQHKLEKHSRIIFAPQDLPELKKHTV